MHSNSIPITTSGIPINGAPRGDVRMLGRAKIRGSGMLARLAMVGTGFVAGSANQMYGRRCISADCSAELAKGQTH